MHVALTYHSHRVDLATTTYIDRMHCTSNDRRKARILYGISIQKHTSVPVKPSYVPVIALTKT